MIFASDFVVRPNFKKTPYICHSYREILFLRYRILNYDTRERFSECITLFLSVIKVLYNCYTIPKRCLTDIYTILIYPSDHTNSQT